MIRVMFFASGKLSPPLSTAATGNKKAIPTSDQLVGIAFRERKNEKED
jgi:hypothetical protein